jgi:hypothetical protein
MNSNMMLRIPFDYSDSVNALRQLLHLAYVLPDCWFLELKQLT